MADLFKSSSGSVVKSTTGSPSFLQVDGLDLNGGMMMLTSLRIDRGQDIQVLKTLSNLYYLYAFGESPGRVLVGGLIFFTNCGAKSTTGEMVGKINSYYDANNAYAKRGPTRIAGGGVSFRCVLNGLSISGDMTPYNYASFSLSFTLIPSS